MVPGKQKSDAFSSSWFSGHGGIPAALPYGAVCRSQVGGRALELLAWSGKAPSPGALLGTLPPGSKPARARDCDLSLYTSSTGQQV